MIEKSGTWPFVSVLVAARNEEPNISTCLHSLSLQNYSGKWEVLVADDHSEDQTHALALSFSKMDSRFRVFSVPEPHSEVKGKALALAILAEKAEGSVFLICDADMKMPTGWIQTMVHSIGSFRVDLLNGTTTTEGKTLFSALQAIDWLIPQGHFSWLSRLGVAYTAMGNNMAITRKAYESTGGYLKIPFSLTEDFELFRQAHNKGYRLIHHFDTSVLGISAPQNHPSGWLQQHIRWMVGFMQLPFSQKWVFYGQLAFYPLLVLSFFLPIPLLFIGFFSMWVVKILANFVLISWVRQWRLLPVLPVYELLWWPSYIICLIAFLTQKSISWKGRIWEK